MTLEDSEPKIHFGQRSCLDTEALCFMCFFKPPKQKPPEALLEKKIRVITVEFNAWEYCGCDYLWAGIVTNLGSQVEEYFGKWKVRLCRLLLKYTSRNEKDRVRSLGFQCCYLRCKLFLLAIFLLSILLVTTTFLVLIGASADAMEDIKKAPFIATVIAFVTAFGAIVAGTL